MSEIEVVDTRPDRSQSKEYHEFECLLDRILVRRIRLDEGTGLSVPDKYKEPQRWGEVISVGQSVVIGGKEYPMTWFVVPGDLVKFGEHTAEQFDSNDEDVYIVRIQDLRGRRRLKRG
jgi:co-chaperonin GroES (HSP10)